MTPEERSAAVDIYNRSIEVANKFGPEIVNETNGDIRTTTTSTALMFTTACIMSKLSMHESINLIMTVYKVTLDQRENT